MKFTIKTNTAAKLLQWYDTRIWQPVCQVLVKMIKFETVLLENRKNPPQE